MQKKLIQSVLVGVLISAYPAPAQLNQVFNNIFTRALFTDFQATGTGVHQNHFKNAAVAASKNLTPALNSLIARNVSSFPLPATSTGLAFDFAAGKVLDVSESGGPILGESAQTLGRGKFNLGLNYTYLNMSSLRGLKTRDLRFTFVHEDVLLPGLGDSENESDVLDLFLDLDVNANIFAAFGTYGITKNFDLGVAIPLINLSFKVDARAVVNSFTFANLGEANHRYNDNKTNPDLDKEFAHHESVSGLGDIGLRLKYSFLQSAGVNMAALLDVRLPTGDEEKFFGTGKTNARLSWIASKKIQSFAPHLNLGYERRGAGLDSDQLEVTLGFAQKLVPSLNFAVEFLGEFDLNKDEVYRFFDKDFEPIFERNKLTGASYERHIDLTNVARRNNDNTLSAAFGFRAAPSASFLILGNVLVALNDGGLRATVAPTFGMTMNF